MGHATLAGPGWLTGTTVVACPAEGAVAGVDVRGGGPGTSETDLLDPRNAVERINALVLSGGSAFGLGTAGGVMSRLAEAGHGVRVPGGVVPIVPTAIVFDLGRGGVFGNYPGARAGEEAYDAAAGSAGDAAVVQGNVGAGTGASTPTFKGGIGSASAVAGDEAVVAALAVVNASGSVVDPRTGTLYGAAFGLPGEFDWLRPPSAADLESNASLLRPPGHERPRPEEPLNTTVGVVAASVPLTKAQCAKLAGVGHDGMARAIRPAHSMFDGDTIFGLAPAEPGPPPSPVLFHDILTAAADCFARAVVHAALSAASVTTPAGHYPCYLDAFPSAGPQS